MRWLVPTLALALVCACTPSEERHADAPEKPRQPPATIEAEPTPVEPMVGNEWFLGFVSQTGTEHCATEFDPQWLAIHSTLGFIPTSGAPLDPWMAKPVLAKGMAIPAPKPELTVKPKPCPMMQMRGDWVDSPQGLRIDRGDHPAIDHFFVTSAEPLTSLKVVREGDELVVELRNPLPFALVDVEMIVHYEGCGGKPGSTLQSREIEALNVDAVATERFAIIVDETPPAGERKGGPTARIHRADSLKISAKPAAGGPTLYVDLDVPFAALGVVLECPSR